MCSQDKKTFRGSPQAGSRPWLSPSVPSLGEELGFQEVLWRWNQNMSSKDLLAPATLAQLDKAPGQSPVGRVLCGGTRGPPDSDGSLLSPCRVHKSVRTHLQRSERVCWSLSLRTRSESFLFYSESQLRKDHL